MLSLNTVWGMFISNKVNHKYEFNDEILFIRMNILFLVSKHIWIFPNSLI